MGRRKFQLLQLLKCYKTQVFSSACVVWIVSEDWDLSSATILKCEIILFMSFDFTSFFLIPPSSQRMEEEKKTQGTMSIIFICPLQSLLLSLCWCGREAQCYKNADCPVDYPGLGTVISCHCRSSARLGSESQNQQSTESQGQRWVCFQHFQSAGQAVGSKSGAYFKVGDGKKGLGIAQKRGAQHKFICVFLD